MEIKGCGGRRLFSKPFSAGQRSGAGQEEGAFTRPPTGCKCSRRAGLRLGLQPLPSALVHDFIPHVLSQSF